MFDKYAEVQKVMTDEVISVRPNETMDRVAYLFETHNVHHIPVCDEHNVVGMISTTDLNKIMHHFTLFKVKNADAVNKSVLRSLLAKEVMSHPVASIRASSTVSSAAAIFRENLFHALPVLDDSGKLVGILTQYDLMNYAFKPDELALMEK